MKPTERDKRTYREIVISMETHIIYVNNHLANIDSHLEKINTTNLSQEVKIARNRDRIALGYKIGGSGLGAIIIGFILKLLGIY